MNNLDHHLSGTRRHLRSFLNDDSGATAIEYAVIGAFLGVAIMISIEAVGAGVLGLLSAVANLF